MQVDPGAQRRFDAIERRAVQSERSLVVYKCVPNLESGPMFETAQFNDLR